MKTYAVTGAASGIGAAVKQQLVNEGHAVISIDIANADIITDLASTQGRCCSVNLLKLCAHGYRCRLCRRPTRRR